MDGIMRVACRRTAATADATRQKGSAAAAAAATGLSTKHRVVFPNRYLPRVFRRFPAIVCNTHTRHTPRGHFSRFSRTPDPNSDRSVVRRIVTRHDTPVCRTLPVRPPNRTPSSYPLDPDMYQLRLANQCPPPNCLEQNAPGTVDQVYI